tara:strand:+ start:1381 stop:1611 length:231 start_codon:yes stop_codon:yes gene_type:complete
VAKKEKKAVLNFDDKEYIIEDMTDEQKAYANHAADLENKMANMRFNLDQLSVGHQCFVDKLRESLNSEPEESEAEA